MTLLSTARRLVQRLGLDVRRHDPLNLPAGRLVRWLRAEGVDVVVDVGANDGGYGRELRQARWFGALLSFEPSSEAHERLRRTARGDPHWHVAPRCALGAQAGAAELQLAGNSASSSLLPMLAAHVQAAPESRIGGTETVPVTTLDACGIALVEQADRLFLKIDTQGFEAQVLAGAAQTLRRCIGIQLELSLIELYEGQTLWRELHDGLCDDGFELIDIVPGFRDPTTGRLLQFDGIYRRTGPAAEDRLHPLRP
jgi:FkbM family methyltransferase